jgi:hypothetical protein
MSRSDQSATTPRSSQPIYYGGALWAFLAVMYFLTQNTGRSDDSVYHLVTAIFEIVAFFAASLLCLRNVLGSNSVSGKDVWLGLGLGLACYCIGSCLFAYWEVVLDQSPDVSLGDLFYVPAYLFLIYGMVMAVIKRQLNLELVQWAMVLMMGVLGIVFAIFVSNAKSANNLPQSSHFFEAPAIAYSLPASTPSPDQPIWQTVEVAQAPSVKPSATAKPNPSIKPSPVTKPIAVPASPLPASPAPEAKPTKPSPEWAKQIDEVLRPYKETINWIYVAADVCLVVIATALLTAFWGGRFSQSWQIIAFAAFSLYIADMWVKYATKVSENYNSGSLPEVFFVFAAVLFGIGATLEYDLSRSRRGGRRRG